MKAERRHELQTNSLAQALQNFPQLMQQYGTRILLVITFIILLIVLLQYRARTVEQHTIVVQQQLAAARSAIAQIRQPDPRLPMDRIVSSRQQLASETEASLSDVLETADSPQLQAEALVARGDLYWALAMAPTFPATQPTTAPAAQRSAEDLYRSAQTAYEQVLNDYPDQPHARVAALFGLAAVAENQQNWDAAHKRYQSVVETSELAMYRDLAERRITALDRLKEPFYIGQPATMPAFDFDAPTAPASTLPEGVAAPTQPSDQDAPAPPATTDTPAAEPDAPAQPAPPAPADQ